MCILYVHKRLEGRDYSSLSCIWIHPILGGSILLLIYVVCEGVAGTEHIISSSALGANSHESQRFPNPDQFLSIVPQPTAHFHFEDQKASLIQQAQVQSHHSLQIRFSMKSPSSPISIILSESWILLLPYNLSTHPPGPGPTDAHSRGHDHMVWEGCRHCAHSGDFWNQTPV